jgi:hypothetical protein
MGISFTKKATEVAAKVGGGAFNFMKTGAAAKQAVQQEDARAEARRLESSKMRDFYLKNNTDGQITFLDGNLDTDGMLEIPRWMQHTIPVGGTYKSYVCTKDADTSQPCPLCEAGDKPSLVGVMTVIDHSSYTVKTGPNAGKVYVNQRRLFIAKDGTIKQLNKLAMKPERNGLALCTFDVSRGPESKHPPRVGDTFDFVGKHKSHAALAEKYELKIEDVQPAIYEGENGEITYLPPEQLLALGLGKAHTGVGYEKGVSAAKDDL